MKLQTVSFRTPDLMVCVRKYMQQVSGIESYTMLLWKKKNIYIYIYYTEVLTIYAIDFSSITVIRKIQNFTAMALN